MVRIRILSGPYAGRERTSDKARLAGIDPQVLLTDLARQGYRWAVDFSDASEEEALEWGLADMVGRILAAAMDGRAVRFMGRRWNFTGIDFASSEAQTMVGEIEDAIVYSGRNIGVLIDDWVSDLVIGVRGYESGYSPGE